MPSRVIVVSKLSKVCLTGVAMTDNDATRKRYRFIRAGSAIVRKRIGAFLRYMNEIILFVDSRHLNPVPYIYT